MVPVRCGRFLPDRRKDEPVTGGRATYRAPRHRQEIEIEIEPPQRALHHALLSSSVRFGLRRYCQCLGIGVGINERIIKAIDVSANQSTLDC